MPNRLVMGSLVALACMLSPRAGQTDDAKPASTKPTPPLAAKPQPPAGPKPVKQETRAELEAEVEQLRAENLKLHKQLDEMQAQETSRRKRMQDQVGQPATTLK